MKRISLQTRVIAALVLVAALLAAPAAAEAKKKLGIDVSRFQGKIKWDKVGKTKVKFAFVQASRGDGRNCVTVPDDCGRDKQYRRNYKGARKEGIAVGPYHRAFFDGNGRKDAKRDARKQAKVFLKQVGKLRGDDLRPVLDFESNGGGRPFGGYDQKDLKVWIETWLDRVQDKLKAKPIIYTNHSSWQATGDTEQFAKKGHLLWVAQFGVDKPLVPADNWAGRGWAVWQYTSAGSVKGIKGNVDENRARVGLKKLEA